MVNLATVVIIIAFYATIVQCRGINLTAIPQDNSNITMSCPSEEKLKAALNYLQGRVQETLIEEITVSTTDFPSTITGPSDNPLCGPGNWRLFFFLDMSDTTQSCPNGWIFSQSPYRACTGTGNSCVSTYIPSGGQGFSEVCGMLAGIEVGFADGFYRHLSVNMQSIERNYMDGVSMT